MADTRDTLNNPKIKECLVPSIFECAGKEVATNVARFDVKHCTPELIVDECCVPRNNLEAAVLRHGSGNDIVGLDTALYVCAPKSQSAVKNGCTKNPVKRIEQLQCGHFEQLAFTHLFWMPNAAAYGSEQLSLRVFGKSGKRLKGEWVNATAEQAAIVLAMVALECKAQISSSAMFIKNYKAVSRAVGYESDSADYWASPYDVLRGREVGLL